MQSGCVCCPSCGARYTQKPVPRGCLAALFAPLEWIAGVYAPASATPELDVTSCHEQIRTGDPDKIRRALGFLCQLGPFGREIRQIVEPLTNHDDKDIALRARDAILAMDAK